MYSLCTSLCLPQVQLLQGCELCNGRQVLRHHYSNIQACHACLGAEVGQVTARVWALRVKLQGLQGWSE